MAALLNLRSSARSAMLTSMRSAGARCSVNSGMARGMQHANGAWRASSSARSHTSSNTVRSAITPLRSFSTRTALQQAKSVAPAVAPPNSSGGGGSSHGHTFSGAEDASSAEAPLWLRVLKLGGVIVVSAAMTHEALEEADVRAWVKDMMAKLRGEEAAAAPIVRPQYSNMILASREQTIFPMNAVTLVLAINVGVFALHHMAPAAWCFKNLYTSAGHIQSRQYHTLLTSVFSHKDPWHLIANCWGIHLFGNLINDDIGDKDFMVFFLVAGVLSSIGSILSAKHIGSAALIRMSRNQPMLGASGSVCGLLGLTAVLHPDKMYSFLLGLVPPMKAEVLVPVAGAFDLGLAVYYLARNQLSSIGHSAHLTGMAFGYLWAHTYLKWFNPTAAALIQSRGTQYHQQRRIV